MALEEELANLEQQSRRADAALAGREGQDRGAERSSRNSSKPPVSSSIRRSAAATSREAGELQYGTIPALEKQLAEAAGAASTARCCARR